VVAVMDADLQHPPEILPALIAPVLSGHADLVAGSRYGWAGADAGLSSPWRHLVSGGCRWLVHLLVPEARPLQDPLSGLFVLRRSLLDGVELQPAGYKILLEVIVRARPATVGNVGFNFGPRHAGRSKASLREGLVFLAHLGRLVSASRGNRPARPERPAVVGTDAVDLRAGQLLEPIEKR
jgi:dolichol-phosphate mannosyltransferase